MKEESDAEFLEKLKRLGNNWRYSDEFIGIIVRIRYPRDYSDLIPGTRWLPDEDPARPVG